MAFCLRRFIWNFFRLENEHLNNCGQFRAVRDISISPIKATDVAIIEKMMDIEDGVLNRPITLNYNPKNNVANSLGANLNNNNSSSHHANNQYMTISKRQVVTNYYFMKIQIISKFCVVMPMSKI